MLAAELRLQLHNERQTDANERNADPLHAGNTRTSTDQPSGPLMNGEMCLEPLSAAGSTAAAGSEGASRQPMLMRTYAVPFDFLKAD
jgi:hypothetical protein